uniref:Bacterial bifunctional deaminase-reductase C-terminal domain-containing protein n=1 Tax=Peronospora matthiolae TaxID=2874970 RepID=A0AAV1TMR5_9STRA
MSIDSRSTTGMTDVVLKEVRRQVCDAQEQWRRAFVDGLEDKELPFVTLSYAQSIDGSLAVERGKSTLLSGRASLKMTHMLRTLHDGILVGVGTVIADNPSLNARLMEGRNPRPVIIDTHLRCPTTIKLFTLPTCEKPIIIYGRGSLDPEILNRKRALVMLGATVVESETALGDDGRNYVDLRDAFRIAKQNGIGSIMVEGGSAILTSCLQGAAQRQLIGVVIVTIAPTFIGGLRAVNTLLTPALPASPAAGPSFPRLDQPRYHILDEDVVIFGHLAH